MLLSPRTGVGYERDRERIVDGELSDAKSHDTEVAGTVLVITAVCCSVFIWWLKRQLASFSIVKSSTEKKEVQGQCWIDHHKTEGMM